METSSLKKYLSLAELAGYLGYHRETVYKKCRVGEIPCRKLPGGKILFVREEIDLWIDGQAAGITNPDQAAKNILRSIAGVVK